MLAGVLPSVVPAGGGADKRHLPASAAGGGGGCMQVPAGDCTPPGCEARTASVQPALSAARRRQEVPEPPRGTLLLRMVQLGHATAKQSSLCQPYRTIT